MGGNLFDEVTKQLKQIEKGNIFKTDDLFNTRRSTENENRVTITFPFDKTSLHVRKTMKEYWSMLNIIIYLNKSLEIKPITSLKRKKS